MPRGLPLSDLEKGQIIAYNESGHSNRWIANRLGRSHDVINSFVSNPAKYGSKTSSGRPQILSPRDKRRILALASNSMISCNKIKQELELNASSETIRRAIHASNAIKRAKLISAPRLTDRHRTQRLEFARKNMQTNFNFVIWSDEKKWNLDGPDGFNTYWHDIRKEVRYFSKRNFGGASLMSWAAFSSQGKLQMGFPSSRMNSDEYQELLEACLIPFLEEHDNLTLRFQQDNAPIHNSASTRSWFNERNIPVLDWPACSPDINVIENVWGLLARRVYADNRQFSNVKELKSEILKCWDEIDMNYLTKLIDSIPNRLFQVINRNGGSTDY